MTGYFYSSTLTFGTTTLTNAISGYADIFVVKIDGNPPSLISVQDVPNDQGGRVMLHWTAAGIDKFVENTTAYSIWRAMSGNQVPATTTSVNGQVSNSAGKKIKHFNVNGLDYYWEWIANQPALFWPQYGYAASTLSDSIAPLQTGKEYFVVVAETNNPNIFYISNVDSGYSIDNLAPIQPAGLIANVASGPSVALSWNADLADPDVGSYSIYRSTTSGFTPPSGNLIGTAKSINFTDASPLSGDLAYYRIIAVDVHGNQSVPSAQASAGIAVSQTYNVQGSWNIISVPLTVSDFSKAALYPTATSSAFGYNGSGYVITSTLTNGTGYWLKFNGAQSPTLTGLLLTNDTINVVTGWNMIGSLSQRIAVSSIASIPGGITTSKFFGYQNGYVTTDSIYPGKGYWIKVNQGGKLVLSSSSQAAPSTVIQIVPTEELPPASPEANDVNLRTIPTSYALEQNYPNPFNPTTIINYALPAQAFVRLTVYNVLGQEVETLVNEMQDAGNRSVEFNANNLPSGLYFYKITAGTFSDMKKMILLK